MTTATISRDETARALRRWARGLRGLEAAVELLLRASDGRFADPTWPWIRVDESCLWLDPEQITRHTDALSALDVRVLTIAESLASGRPLGHIADLLGDLDRHTLRLVLAAFCHAGGGRTHHAREPGGDGVGHWVPLEPLVDWS